MTDTLGTTQYTFSDVLKKLFKKEQLPPKLTEKDFSKGLLCSGCKHMVDDLFRLQYELRDVKNEIVSTFKRSQKSEKKKKETVESGINGNVSEEAAHEKKESKAKENKKQEKEKEKNKQVNIEPKDDVYIIEMLKEKKGDTFLVKWENYPEDENTWEPKSSIPDYIIKVRLTK